MIEIKKSGKTLIFFIIVLILFYILFNDILLLYTSILILAIILYKYIIAIRKAKWMSKSLNIEPEEISLRIIAGSKKIIKAKIVSNKSIKLFIKHPIKFCTIKPQLYVTNNDFIIEIAPNLAGLYKSDELYIENNMALFIAKANIPFKTDITVIPRVIPMAIRALELITSISQSGLMYEIPLIKIGRGSEYAETREYMSGDDIRYIDWKATSRLQKLMIKQFHEEVGGEVNLIYDLKTKGPISTDIIATEFLNLAMDLIIQNIPFQITIIDEENKIETLRFNDYKNALLTIVKYALKSIKIDYTFLYSIIGPHSSKDFELLLKIINEEIPIKSFSNNWKLNNWKDAIVFSCLIGDLTWLIDIWNEVNRNSGKLIVHTPAKIWLDSQNLEQAYIDYINQVRLIESLKRRGIIVKVH